MTIAPQKIENVAQLRWLCRRGMLELDLLLNQFLDKQYQNLTVEEQGQFKELLNCSDPELYAWLLKTLPVPDPQWESLLQKIREYVPCK